MTTNYPKQDNAFADEVRDNAKGHEFASILHEQESIRSQIMALRKKEAELQERLVKLTGLKSGQTVELEDGMLGILTAVEAEAFISPRTNVIYLRATGPVAPLTKSGEPHRTTRKRFRHFLWHVSAPMLKQSTTWPGPATS